MKIMGIIVFGLIGYVFYISLLNVVEANHAAPCSHRESPKEYDSLCIQLANKANTHQCRWPLCPYKGIDTAKAAQSVANYVGETGVDAYYIDLYHIKYPNYEYEQLDSLLTMEAYAHIGQHTGIDMLYVDNSREASKLEYEPLHKELINLGYENLFILNS